MNLYEAKVLVPRVGPVVRRTCADNVRDGVRNIGYRLSDMYGRTSGKDEEYFLNAAAESIALIEENISGESETPQLSLFDEEGGR